MQALGKSSYRRLVLTLYSIDTHFNSSTTDTFWKHSGKEEIARNKQFLLFLQCFLPNQKIVSPFVNIYDIISLFAAELEDPKFGIWGKGLKSLPSQGHWNLKEFGKRLLFICLKGCIMLRPQLPAPLSVSNFFCAQLLLQFHRNNLKLSTMNLWCLVVHLTLKV